MALAIGAALFADAGVRSAAKTRLVSLDAEWVGGWIRRSWLRQSLPRLPRDLPDTIVGAYAWLGDEPFLSIAHALGPGLASGPNSASTFRNGLRLGFRIFEVDLALTADDSLVCHHGGAAAHELDTLTWNGYVGSRQLGRQDPCRFADLVEIARTHPDVRFVLDVKNRFAVAYDRARALIADSVLGQQFIPQIYFFEQLPWFRRDAFFAGVVFTSYRSALTTGQILATAHRARVRVVTLTLQRFGQLRSHPDDGLVVLAHTTDDPSVAWQLRLAGAGGVYTSYLTPRTMPELFAACPQSDSTRERQGGRQDSGSSHLWC